MKKVRFQVLEVKVQEEQVETLMEAINYVRDKSLTSQPAFIMLIDWHFDGVRSGFRKLNIDLLKLIIKHFEHPYDQAMNGMKDLFKRSLLWDSRMPHFIPLTSAPVSANELLWKGDMRDLVVKSANKIMEEMDYAIFNARYQENSFKFETDWELDELKRNYIKHIANILKKRLKRTLKPKVDGDAVVTAWDGMPDDLFIEIFSHYFRAYLSRFDVYPQVYDCEDRTDLLRQILKHEREFRLTPW